MALNIPYAHDFIKLCRQQAQAIQNHNKNVRNVGKGKAQHRKRKRLYLGGEQTY
jgi:hypothetical protein